MIGIENDHGRRATSGEALKPSAAATDDSVAQVSWPHHRSGHPRKSPRSVPTMAGRCRVRPLCVLSCSLPLPNPSHAGSSSDREDAIMYPSFSRSDTLIMVMKASNFGDDFHWPIFRWFDGAGYWAVHGKGKMGPKSVVVAEVSR